MRKASFVHTYFPKNKCNCSSEKKKKKTASISKVCTVSFCTLNTTISVQCTHPVDICQSFPELSCSFVAVQSSLDWFMRGLQKWWENTSDSADTNDQNYHTGEKERDRAPCWHLTDKNVQRVLVWLYIWQPVMLNNISKRRGRKKSWILTHTNTVPGLPLSILAWNQLCRLAELRKTSLLTFPGR